MHCVHSYVLFKIQLGLYEGFALLPWFETKKLHLGLYAIILLLLLLLTGQYLKCRTHGRDQSQGHLTEVRTKSVN